LHGAGCMGRPVEVPHGLGEGLELRKATPASCGFAGCDPLPYVSRWLSCDRSLGVWAMWNRFLMGWRKTEPRGR
jgi:hypothetical protein